MTDHNERERWRTALTIDNVTMMADGRPYIEILIDRAIEQARAEVALQQLGDGPHHCWCGGEIGPRTPGDEHGLGCLSDIWHLWKSSPDFMPKLKGRSFRCICGANVFKKQWDEKSNRPLYVCNGCSRRWEAETLGEPSVGPGQ